MPFLLIFDSAPSAQVNFKYDDDKLSWRSLLQAGKLDSGRWIDTEGICLSAKTTRRSLPSVFAAGYYYAVNREIAAAIESQEPGQHQLIPLKITAKDNADLPGYCLLNVSNTVDAIDESRTTAERMESKSRGYAYNTAFLGMDPKKQVLVRAADVRGLAVWRDYHLTGPFLSDEIGQIIIRSKARVRVFPVSAD